MSHSLLGVGNCEHGRMVGEFHGDQLAMKVGRREEGSPPAVQPLVLHAHRPPQPQSAPGIFLFFLHLLFPVSGSAYLKVFVPEWTTRNSTNLFSSSVIKPNQVWGMFDSICRVREKHLALTTVGLRMRLGVRCISVVRPFIIDPLSYFSFQPVLHDWCNKGMCYPVYGMVHIKEHLLLIAKGSPLSLAYWSFTIYPTPYNRK